MSENELARGIRPSPEEGAATYAYLDSTDLNDQQIIDTLSTYDNFAEVYSEQDWSSVRIEVVWEKVFSLIRNVIEKLPKNGNVLIVGCGTLKDLVSVNLLRQDVNVFGFDLSPGMLKVGLNKLTMEEIRRLAFLLDELDFLPHGWIQKILDLAEVLDSNKFTQFSADFIESAVKEKIHLVEGDLKHLFFPSGSFDLIMAIATLPHIKKKDTREAIIYMIQLLNKGGVLHFNLKLDRTNGSMNVKRRKGRVFKDDVLGEERYFNTYTMEELDNLLNELQQMFPDASISANYETRGVPNVNKPPFANVTITMP